jgi:FtsP/CotA-like multicopper oxidase with cupredoxin domain
MPTVSRRTVMAGGAGGAAGLFLGNEASAVTVPTRGAPLLDASAIPKFVSPLLVPPPMPGTTAGAVDRYVIGVRQIRQQVLPRGMPATTVWGYGAEGMAGTFNARTWPDHRVERRRYRLRLLNGCNSRFLVLAMATDATARPASPAVPFWQVGADLGFLPEPVPMQRLLLAPAERADVVVDFSGFPAGTRLFLVNEGPDEPFGGGEPGGAFDWADPATTGQVMAFTVVDRVGPETSTSPEELSLPAPPPPPPAVRTRSLALLEADSEVLAEVGPRAAFLGTIEGAVALPLAWDDAVTETPSVGDTEVWELHNSTADAHPIRGPRDDAPLPGGVSAAGRAQGGSRTAP